MKHFRPFLLLFVLLLLNASAAEQPLAQSTIVLYNKAVSDSVELAKFYAEQRGIAADHLIGLTCSTEEEISREEYDRTVADPLREIFKQRHWWTLREPPGQAPVTNRDPGNPGTATKHPSILNWRSSVSICAKFRGRPRTHISKVSVRLTSSRMRPYCSSVVSTRRLPRQCEA